MNQTSPHRVAILYPGDRETRRKATPHNNRLAPVFQSLADLDIHAEPAVYHDDFCEAVRRQLMALDAVLVWHNPIQDGRDRSTLDAILRDLAAAGKFVSTHPDIILKMGTKEVVYRTREMGWGSDTHLYTSLDALRRELPERLVQGEARVLKQYRGNGGEGVWKVSLAGDGTKADSDALVHVRHAKKGSVETQMPLEKFYRRCGPYFIGNGRLIDQAYQVRLPDGMVRCYLVHDRVVGFGHQAVNALFPAPPGAPASAAPKPGPRRYHPPTMPQFQALKSKLEGEWVSEMQGLLEIPTEDLPIIWDCDFLLGPRDASGEDSYVLCEINVSSIAPFPDSAPPHIAKATLSRLRAMKGL